MAHRHLAFECGKGPFVNHLSHQAKVLHAHHGVAVAHRDAGAFLASVLQGLQPKVSLATSSEMENTPNTAHSSWGLSGASPGKMDVAMNPSFCMGCVCAIASYSRPGKRAQNDNGCELTHP